MRTIGMLAIPLLVASAGAEAQELNGTTVATARPAISQSSPAQTVSRPPARETFGREVFVSLGRAWLFEGIGKWPSFGAGVTLPLASRFALQLEANRMLGTRVRTFSSVRRVDLNGPEQRFEYQSGTSYMTVANASLLYYFSRRRVQPFIGGALSMVWREGADLCLLECIGTPQTTRTFRTIEPRGSARAGLRIPLGRFSVTPEVKLYTASVAVGYRW